MNYNMLISTSNSLIMNMVMEMEVVVALVAVEVMSQVRYKISRTNMTNMLMK